MKTRVKKWRGKYFCRLAIEDRLREERIHIHWSRMRINLKVFKSAYRKRWLQVFHFLGRHNQAGTFIRLRYIRSRIWSRYSAIVASLRHSSVHLLTSHDSWINSISMYICSHDLHSQYSVPGTDFVRVAFERFYLDTGLTRSIERRLKSLRIFPRVI